MKPRLLLLTLVLVVAVASVSWGATTGKITGVITDSQNGEPIVGASVVVVGTTLGASTDAEGSYTIINVPVGTYELRISTVGFATLEVSNVEVSADLASYQDHSLSSEAADIGKTIHVTAEAPLVVPDKTGAISIVKKEELLALPTRGFEDIVGIQNSVVRLNSFSNQRQRGTRESTGGAGEFNVRGGRRSEVAYYVDGFSQQDPLSGISTANISNNAIQEVSILSGGFPAEYGHVSSGIINTITNSGTSEYHGTAEVVTDEVGPQQSYKQNWYSGTLGGPIPGLSNSTFFGSVERRWHGDREPTGTQSEVLPGFPDLLPHNGLKGWSWQGKLDFGISQNLKFQLSTNGSRDEWSRYQHSYFFNQGHIPFYDDRNMGINGKITHTLSPKAFYNLSVSFFEVERFRGDGVYRKNLEDYYQSNGNPRFDTEALFWLPGHVYDDYLKRKSSYIGFKGDITTQPDRYHTIKTGFDFQRHTLRYYRHLFPASIFDPGGFGDIDYYGYDSLANEVESENGRNAVKNPINLALFVDDRIEWRGLIINAGLRFDYFDYKARRIINPQRPLDPNNVGDSLAFTLEDADLEDSEKFTRVSPRLGVAFPVSENTQVRLNYGKFFQRPDLLNLYVGDDYFQHKVNLGGYYYSFGNPNLEPEKTTAYEVGFTRQLGENTVLNASVYYKDVVDLVQVVNVPAAPNSYATYINTDYATIKGLEFELTMRRTRNISMSTKYTLSYSNGTGSYTTTQQNIAWQSTDAPKQPAPLDFDQRHSLIVNVDWRTSQGQGPMLGDMHPLENTGVNILMNAGSGLPYTRSEIWNEVTLGAGAPVPEAPRNSDYGPWTWTIDMKIERTFNFGSYSIVPYLWIKNLLNRDNEALVYESTGRANSTNWLETESGQAFAETNSEVDDGTGLNGKQKYELAQNNPLNYGLPRQIYAGLRVTF